MITMRMQHAQTSTSWNSRPGPGGFKATTAKDTAAPLPLRETAGSSLRIWADNSWQDCADPTLQVIKIHWLTVGWSGNDVSICKPEMINAQFWILPFDDDDYKPHTKGGAPVFALRFYRIVDVLKNIPWSSIISSSSEPQVQFRSCAETLHIAGWKLGNEPFVFRTTDSHRSSFSWSTKTWIQNKAGMEKTCKIM